ncbi:MAG: type VI secretion system tip protein VgrG [Polyangiaceae bacterium]|nr:type VI secretion system tip protein VgrG [Polyangiaceae bacterium]
MSDSALFQLWVRGFSPDHFRVRTFRGREEMSQPYRFDIQVTCPASEDVPMERAALGRPAALCLRGTEIPRVFHGFLAAAKLTRLAPVDHAAHLTFRLVPRFWALTKRINSRIFQRMSVPQVVTSVLARHNIRAEWRLRYTYPEREYNTQYEESDAAFVERLLAENGIFYFFPNSPEPTSDTDLTAPCTMVMGDDPTMVRPLDDVSGSQAPTLHYLEGEGTSTFHGNKITHFEPSLQVRTTSATYREFDPERPHALLTTYASTLPSAGTPLPGGISTEGAVAPLGIDLEEYDHHGSFLFPVWGHAMEEAGRMLRQARRNAALSKGTSHVSTLGAGTRFTLEDYPAAAANRAWVAVKVSHAGRSEAKGAADAEVYTNKFVCVPADVAYPPSRPERRSVQVALTATVVGPSGDDIYTDPLGQIRVRFHWDRELGSGEASSCWIRTMQPWSGAGWGHQFIPRVGMEVVVVFEGGDPDKPLVMGTVYNGTHPPPFRLPAEKTRSGIKTQSTPGGSGNNELSFEDAAGAEQVYLHAQRDLDTLVERNRTLTVRGAEKVEVAGDRTSTLGGSEQSRVGGSVERQVGGDENLSTQGSRVDVVSGNLDTRISGNTTLRVGGRTDVELGGAITHTYHEDSIVRSKGNITEVVGTNGAARSHTLFVEGVITSHGTERIELTSDKEIVFRVGKSIVRVTEDRIELNSPTIAAKGGESGLTASDDGMDLRAKSTAQIVTDTLLFKTEGASLAMAKEVKIDGQQILLNSPEQAKDPPPKDPVEPTLVELTDLEGNPLPYQRFVVLFDDGSEQVGVTDKEGKASLITEKDGKIVFPDLSNVAGG